MAINTDLKWFLGWAGQFGGGHMEVEECSYERAHEAAFEEALE